MDTILGTNVIALVMLRAVADLVWGNCRIASGLAPKVDLALAVLCHNGPDKDHWALITALELWKGVNAHAKTFSSIDIVREALWATV